MKTFDERMHSIREKSAVESKKRRKRRAAAGALATVFTVALALVLFMPYSTALPDVSRYSDSPYYNVIQGLNKATYSAPKYKNNFHMLASQLANFNFLLKNEVNTDGILGLPQLSPAPGAPMDPTLAVPEGMPNYGDPGDSYEEVTDNQVEGVIEADLFKRSDKYLYYLHGKQLRIYSIAKEESEPVGSYRIDPFLGTGVLGNYYAPEMYLTKDCSTLIVLFNGSIKNEGNMTILVTLDVTDPSNVVKTGVMLFTGWYVSSRMVGDDVLVTCNYGVSAEDIDYDNPETYVPKYGAPGEMQQMDAEDIFCPQAASESCYTVVAKLDGKTLQVKDTKALLSYSQGLYVSEDTIYATHAFTKTTDEGGYYHSAAMTEITGISYLGDTLEILGSIQINGSVKNQYSMDQHNGILRVAASTEVMAGNRYNGNGAVITAGTVRNCSLYCIDLSTWEIAASVEEFAPEGDEVTSARFDGNTAYICTAEVIIMTDPVYFFDLSDLNNITWTDTGIIDGFSSSLINFGEYLLGIGRSDVWGLKIEAYAQGEGKVESLAKFELRCAYPVEYKAYFIDREHNLLGMAVMDYEIKEPYYMLLQFDGEQFYRIQKLPMERFADARAAMIDGWLYVLYDDQLIVQQVLDFDENR